MSAKFFLDTDILIYSFDARFPEKQTIAQELVERALDQNRGFISSQVVQEFLNVALSKFQSPLSVFEAESYMNRVLAPLCGVYTDLTLCGEALILKEGMKISFYDALIICGALRCDCRTLYSEDLQDGREFRNLRIENPFK